MNFTVDILTRDIEQWNEATDFIADDESREGEYTRMYFFEIGACDSVVLLEACIECKQYGYIVEYTCVPVYVPNN